MSEDIEGELMSGDELELLGRARGRRGAVESDEGLPEPSEPLYYRVEDLVSPEIRAEILADRRKGVREDDWGD